MRESDVGWPGLSGQLVAMRRRTVDGRHAAHARALLSPGGRGA